MTGWTKVPLGTEVGLGPDYIVLDGDPAPPKGAQPPIFGLYLLWPNGRPFQLMLSTCTFETVAPKRFALCHLTVVFPVCNVGVLRPKGWMGQDATWYGDIPRFRPHCVT